MTARLDARRRLEELSADLDRAIAVIDRNLLYYSQGTRPLGWTELRAVSDNLRALLAAGAAGRDVQLDWEGGGCDRAGCGHPIGYHHAGEHEQQRACTCTDCTCPHYVPSEFRAAGRDVQHGKPEVSYSEDVVRVTDWLYGLRANALKVNDVGYGPEGKPLADRCTHALDLLDKLAGGPREPCCTFTEYGVDWKGVVVLSPELAADIKARLQWPTAPCARSERTPRLDQVEEKDDQSRVETSATIPSTGSPAKSADGDK